MCRIQQVANPVETNARGAGILAAVALGFGTFAEVAAGLPIRRIFRPNPAHREMYARMFQAYLELYRAHRKICARLNQSRAREAK